jgi:glycosyltransferase involved in cell wall biosynthesis
MRIAVNTRLLLSGKLEGIGWFAFETLKRIVESHPEHEFIFIFDRKPSSEFKFGDNVKMVVAHPQARHPFLWYLFFEIGVYRALKKIKPDIFLSPDGWLCLKTKTPSLAVIHDLNFEAHPEFIPNKLITKYYHYFFPRFAKKATRIATVSEYTKQDLQSRYRIAPDKIDVVYNGANNAFSAFSNEEIAKVRNRFSKGQPYFLFVGLIHPRKNLENQLKAFEVYKKSTGHNTKFIVVGERYSTSSELAQFEQTSPVREDVIFLGRQTMEALTELYGGALALSYLSYFEGFGIPILEAFCAEIPVITSNVSSMPEICGDAGLVVDPYNIEAIADAMGSLASDQKLRQLLIEKGRIQKMKFSWDKTASALWTSIQKTYESAYPNRRLV